MKYNLFGFQNEAVEAGLKVLLSNKKCYEVLIAPTAAGKSLIIAEIVKRLPLDGCILIVQPNKELTEQNVEKLEASGITPSIYSASLGKKEFGRIIYATPLSLKADNFKDKNIKYVLWDEADNMSKHGSALPLFLRNIGVKNCLGLTATPIYLMATREGAQLKMMNRVFGKTFQDICYVIQPKELVALGRWSEIIYKDYEFDSERLVLNSNGSDFTQKSLLESYVDLKQEDKILKLINSLPQDESILVFIPGIDNVEALTKYIPGSVCVTNNTKKSERDELVRGFKSGKHRIMINAGIFAVGFDYPDLRHVIDAFPTNSARIYIQRVGRAVRVSKETGKMHATYHCMSGNFNKFGRVEDINYEYIEGYGWGMFAGDILLSGVPMGERLNITKDKLRNKEKEAEKRTGSSYDFEFDFNTLTPSEREVKFKFGKFSGRTVKWIYEEDKNYLKWIIDPKTKFNFFTNKELQKVLLKIFNV